jgi:uncharacterized protein YuzE
MKIQHFKDTDTIYIQFTNNPVVDTSELNENTLLDLDKDGGLVAITIEHASEQAILPYFAYEQLPLVA